MRALKSGFIKTMARIVLFFKTGMTSELELPTPLPEIKIPIYSGLYNDYSLNLGPIEETKYRTFRPTLKIDNDNYMYEEV